MSVATITQDPHDPDDAIVRFRYNERAIAAIRLLPSRRWDKHRKVWIVPADSANATRVALERAGLTVTVDIVATATTAPELTPIDAIDRLLSAVPHDQQRRVLRAVAAATHPDAGGDLELSKHVNARLAGVS